LKIALIDLDGTLVDPARGIIRGFQIALTALGHPAPPASELTWVIGPPGRWSFAKLLGSGERVEEAIAHYRAFYAAQGLYDATPYEGVHGAVAALADAGLRLFICTSKPERFARTVAENFGFASLFENIYGPDLDGRLDDKGDLMQHLLEREGIVSTDACMIGDRLHDVVAAQRHGLRSVGVLWGYGGREELETAGASALCASPADLQTVVAGLRQRPAPIPILPRSLL
jgi:phosphoglycolate phosphatase